MLLVLLLQGVDLLQEGLDLLPKLLVLMPDRLFLLAARGELALGGVRQAAGLAVLREIGGSHHHPWELGAHCLVEFVVGARRQVFLLFPHLAA